MQEKAEKLNVCEDRKKFHDTLKDGIYKQLHKEKLLTDVELNILLQKNRKSSLRIIR